MPMRPGSYSGATFARGEPTALASSSSSTHARAVAAPGSGSAHREVRRVSQPASAGSTPTVRSLRNRASPALIDAMGIDTALLPQFVGYAKGGHHAHNSHNDTLHNRSSAAAAGVSVSASTLDNVFEASKGRSLHAGTTGGSSRLFSAGLEPATDTLTDALFAAKRRLPSILLDSWELRKIAPEGSVLPNALASWDVDGDGVEEILVGTTEGHFFILKPDCRMPVYAYTLSATISVVLYSEQMRRLILITLEGQCEVFDDFPMPPAVPAGRARNTAASGRAAGATSPAPPVTTTNTTTTAAAAAASSAAARDGAASMATSAAASARAALLRSKRMPQHGSVTSLGTSVDGTGSYLESKNNTPTTVFHVASNCLCAEMATEPDHRDLLFLGSFDNRLYVYSIEDGTCLLSLFMHQPITCLKTFSLPCHVPLPPTPLLAHDDNDEDRRAEAAAAVQASGRAPLSDPAQSKRAPVDVPLIAVTTSTSVVLLPACYAELQRWRRQERRTGRPLTLADGDTIRHYHDLMRLRKKNAARAGPAAPVPTAAGHNQGTATREDDGDGEGPAEDGLTRANADVLAARAPSSVVSAGVTTDSVTALSPWTSTTTGPRSSVDVLDRANASTTTSVAGDSAGLAGAAPKAAPVAGVSARTVTTTVPAVTAEGVGPESETLVKEFARPPMTLLQPLWYARLGARNKLIVPPALSPEDMASGKFGVLNAAKRHRGRGVRPGQVGSQASLASPARRSQSGASSGLEAGTKPLDDDGLVPHARLTASEPGPAAPAPTATTAAVRPSRLASKWATGPATAASPAPPPPQTALMAAESADEEDAASWLPVSVDVSVGGKRAMMVLSSEDGRAFVVSLTPLMENGDSALATAPTTGCGPLPLVRVPATGKGSGSASCAEAAHTHVLAGRTILLCSKREYTPPSPRSAKKASGHHGGPLSFETVTSFNEDTTTDASSSDDGSHQSGPSGPAIASSYPATTTTGTSTSTARRQLHHDIILPLPPTARQLQKQQQQQPRPARPTHHHHRPTPLAPPNAAPNVSTDGGAGGGVGNATMASPGSGGGGTGSVASPTGDWADLESPFSSGSPCSPATPAPSSSAPWPPAPVLHRRLSHSGAGGSHDVPPSAASGSGGASPSSAAAATTTATTELTLRLQCEWSAHLGPMPLVQRARIFVTEGEDTFTVVLVAANGRCYSFDPDSAAAVECTVKADCSSFTLVAGNSCSAEAALAANAASAAGAVLSPAAAAVERASSRSPSGLTPRWSESVQTSHTPSGLGNRPGVLYMSPKTGDVRPVFCVCVSVDELGLYSVGEAHNTSAIPFSTTSALATKDPARAASEPSMKGGGTADIFEGGNVCDGMGHFIDVRDERELLLELGHALIEAAGGEASEDVETAATPAERDERVIWMVREVLTRDYSAADWNLLQQFAVRDEL